VASAFQVLRQLAQQRGLALDARAELRFERERVRDQLGPLLFAFALLGSAQPAQHHRDEDQRQQQRQRPQAEPAVGPGAFQASRQV
jgi:hypothetical protein